LAEGLFHDEAYRWAKDTCDDLLHPVPLRSTVRPGSLDAFTAEGIPVITPPPALPRKRRRTPPIMPHVGIMGRSANPGEGLSIVQSTCVKGHLPLGSDEPLQVVGEGDRTEVTQAQYEVGRLPDDTRFGLRFRASQGTAYTGRLVVVPFIGSQDADVRAEARQQVRAFIVNGGFSLRPGRDPLHDNSETDRFEAVQLLNHCVQQAGVWPQLTQRGPNGTLY
jgi:hypothetical protein